MVCCPTRQRKEAVEQLIKNSTFGDDLSPSAQTRRNKKIVHIPGGVGHIGTNQPKIPVDGENPLRTKRIKSFLMDSCTVTNARFQEFINETGYITEAERLGDSLVFHSQLAPDFPPTQGIAVAPWWRVVMGANWLQINGPKSEEAWHPEYPVVHISWRDATAFAEWAGGRLPTEAEWEHAARGGQQDVRFPWGDKEPNDKDFFPCNIWQGRFPNENTGKDGYFGVAPSESFKSNKFGLYNMVGNVWEWTSEPFKVRSLKKVSADAHGYKKGYKLLKGGSFLCHASYCYRYRIAARTGNSPDTTTTHQGFRLVYDL